MIKNMIDYVKKYELDSNPRNVWLEIIKKSENNNEDVNTEKVLDSLMLKVKLNIETLKEKLPKLGYNFNQDKITGEPEYHLLNKLKSELKEYGSLPLSFIKFFELVGFVDFRGSFPVWKDNENIPHLDPLVIHPINEILEYLKWQKEEPSSVFRDEENKVYLWFSPDQFMKDKVSGGIGYGIYLHSKQKIDAELANFGYKINFVDYLRICFRWAGFPNLEWFKDEPKVNEHPLFKQIQELGASLIPI